MKLELIVNTNEVALVEVSFYDDMDRMSHPGFTGEEAYIKIVKGETVIFTIYGEKNKVKPLTTFCMDSNKSTQIDESLKIVRDKTILFLLSKGININKNTAAIEKKLTVFFTKEDILELGEYQVLLGGKHAIYLKNEEEIEKIFGPYKRGENKESENTRRTYFQAEIL